VVVVVVVVVVILLCLLFAQLLPAFVLSIEDEELGVSAGLQDRVLQTYVWWSRVRCCPGIVRALC